jgi:uncharacterized membrane protein
MIAPPVGRGQDTLAQASLSNRLSKSIARYLEPGIEWIASFIVHHWLLISNTMLFFFIALPFLAPLLNATGFHLPAKIIFLIYRPTCHQLPERSFWVAGHQVAICARCSSIYVSFWVIGMTYALWATIYPSRIPAWKAPPLWAIGVAAIPLGLDGITQLFGFRTSTNLLRMITGSLVGATTAAVIYPYMHSGFKQARQVWETNNLRSTCTEQHSENRLKDDPGTQ